MVGCWHGYLSVARCRYAYGPTDATATHCLLLPVKSRSVLPFWYWLTRVVPDKVQRAIKWMCICVCVILYLLPPSTMIHSILPVQFTCLTVFLHNLSPSPLWSASWSGTLHLILHTFFHPIIVFSLQNMPIPMQPVATPCETQWPMAYFCVAWYYYCSSESKA